MNYNYIIEENVTNRTLKDYGFYYKNGEYRYKISCYKYLNGITLIWANFHIDLEAKRFNITVKDVSGTYYPYYMKERMNDKLNRIITNNINKEINNLIKKGIIKNMKKNLGSKDYTAKFINVKGNPVILAQTIKIKYFDKEIDKIEKINQGDLIDLRAAETVEMKQGDFKLIRLGVGMKLPEGYKANVYPRSSTYKNFGIILANSVGQIDNSYSGENDEWRFPAIALRDTVIHKNDRICQFEIQKIQPKIIFEEVEHLDEVSRGGIGSTGKA